MSLNSVNIMGNLTRDPEMRYLPSGAGVCNLSIANNRIYTKDGEKKEEVSFFNIDVWGAQGENCNKYLTKGSGVIIEGRLRQDRWEKDGKTQTRVLIVANSVHFLPRKGGGDGSVQQRQTASATTGAKEIRPEDVAWDE
ncbi:Single-stranded DNA-binding protein [hydrothermal vent metagenome]|uniref:Single-stranded DNA-binding protein n=1 Tax=hydrothermal vent metagenome TaxID=652676 RepID=A0A3B1D5D9_9ZZZZ